MVWDGDGFRAMLDRLDQVRKSMAGAKNTKLMMRWEKHGDYSQWPSETIMDALYSEWVELDDAIDSGVMGDIRDEVLDVANVLEFLWDVLGLARA